MVETDILICYFIAEMKKDDTIITQLHNYKMRQVEEIQSSIFKIK